MNHTQAEASAKNRNERNKKIANSYEWFSDEVDYFRCSEMINVFVEMHFHSSWEFIFVAEGRLCALLDGVEYVAEAGDILFIPGFVLHYVPCAENNRCFSVVFSQNFRKTFDEEYGKGFDFLLKNQGAKTAEVFRFVEACLKKFSTFNLCEKHGFADMFLGMLAKTYPLKSLEKKPPEQIIINVLRYIDLHFTQNITVERVAETFGYSKNYLSFLFNKYTGMGFCDYLSRVRITEAMKRLSEEKNESGVTAIAMECGFNSMNTFYRAKHKFVTCDLNAERVKIKEKKNAR